VIIEAIKESRRIFQRMNSYAIYRIAETLRVLVFISLVILIYNFFPVTAIQIVMLALLNDGAILSIAYDKVRYKDQPEAWNMRLVLGIATVLGVVGPIAAFGLFYLGDNVFHLNHAHIQTLMYLTLSVAGHLTVFLARTRGPFWSIRPARVLVLAVVGTQTLATLIAVYGIFMTPIGWRYAGLVWGYALACFLVTDRVKLVAYRILDPVDQPMVKRALVSADGPAPSPSSAQGSTAVAPFHSDIDSDDPVYHDNETCPHGREVKRHANAKSGRDGRRRCDWCTEHTDRPAPMPAGATKP
jgi:H+-transporting ATPase